MGNPTKILRYSSDPRFKRAIANGMGGLNMSPRQAQTSDVSAGSTLQRKHSLPIIATRYFTDINGTILAKTDAGLVAAGMATDYPLFVLGEFDREGGYRTGLSSLYPAPVAALAAPVILTTFVNGVTGTSNSVVTPYSPFNTIQARLRQGDMVTVYVDNIALPNYYCFMVQTNNYAALASILSNLKSIQHDNRLGPLWCYEVNWYAPEAQWDLPLHFITSDNLGTWKDNQVQPYIFKTPYNVIEGFLTVKTQFVMNQYIEVALMYQLATDQMSFNFNIQKVDQNG